MMIVEVGINSYITTDELDTYANDIGITLTGDITILIARSMRYIETRNYIGIKTVYNQPLQFPRILCDSSYGNYSSYPQNYSQPCHYDSATVPHEIKKAQCEACLLIAQGYDLQSPITQAIKREKVSSLEVEYQDYSNSAEIFRSLDDILRPFMQSGLRVVRT